MDTVEIRLIFCLSIFGIKSVTMATSHLMTGRYIPHFGLHFLSVKFFHTLPHHGNDIA